MRISGETRAATASKNAQQACRMVMPRSSSASSIGPCSVEDGEKEMPQKSTEPVPTLSSTTSRGKRKDLVLVGARGLAPLITTSAWK